jgi:translation initiation factor eIF-2B subunit alpha
MYVPFQGLACIWLSECYLCSTRCWQFARLYPLEQRDLGLSPCHVDFVEPVPEDAEVANAARDYTPPSYLTLLFTDLGVLTPSAVSDELIQLYL